VTWRFFIGATARNAKSTYTEPNGLLHVRRVLMRKIVLWMAGLALLTGGVANAQDAVPRFEEGDCTVSLSDDTGVSCGMLIVPLDYDDPDGEVIRVPVVRIEALSTSPDSDPVVMLQGGPGGSSIDYFTEPMLYHPLRETRDIYMIDQRGTLYADTYLFCEEIFEFGESVLDEILTLEEANARYLEELQACVTRFTEEGVNFSDYDSVAYAGDINALRTAFEFDTYNLYGVSYGTQLAQFVMANHPDGLRSVILDAVVPLDVNDNFNIEKRADRVFDELFAACASLSVCNTAYPELEAVFYKTVDNLNAEPAEIDIYDPNRDEFVPAMLDGYTLLNFMFSAMYADFFLPVLPGEIYNFNDGDYSFIESYAGYFFLDRTLADAQYWATNCSDDAVAVEGDDGIENDDIAPQIIAWNEGSDAASTEACAIVNAEPLDASSDTPITLDVPTLVLSGQFDPITPPVFAERVANGLPTHYFYTFTGLAHGAFGNLCADAMMTDFINDPDRAPDSSCMDALIVEFTAPVVGVDLVEWANTDLGISGLAPDGWYEVDPGILQPFLNADTPFLGYRVPDDGLEGYVERIIINNYGYDELPEPVETVTTEANGLTWNLYEIEGLETYALFAFTEAEDGTGYVIVVGGTTEAERDILVEQGLRPALEAFVPGE
jgi:pimeloyl-ACP methyl ester carboxylesterase